jgi:Amt family ammonium transporter
MGMPKVYNQYSLRNELESPPRAGVTGVVGSIILGSRKEDIDVRSEQTILMTFVGGCFLWFGWFGFNAGSVLTAGNASTQ